MSVGLSFKRARLHYVYSILRGKDLETEQFSEERREQQFEVLKKAQERVLNLQYWHDFMKAIRQAGFRSMKMISSQNNLLFSYVFYLMGRTEYGVEEFVLRRVIARWFFMSSLTLRYTSSPESTMEFDLARFREVRDADGFVRTLEQVCDQSLTDDFWNIRLPNELATSSPRSPSLFAYYAALVLLDAKALFSNQSVSELLDPTIQAKRAALERHHLFPKGYLKTFGIMELRETNQIANYAPIEWGDNSNISDRPPAEYVPILKERFSAGELEQMYYWHALPDNWESLEYGEFLIRRREHIAQVIADGYAKIAAPGKATAVERPVPLPKIVLGGETTEVEFKSTMRINLHTGEKDLRMELGCLKTIAGFLNTNRGTLIIGVSNDGRPLGIDADKFSDEDKMSLHLVNLVKTRMGPQYMAYVHPRFDEYDGKRVMVVDCWESRSPVFVKDGDIERFYIRTGPSTVELTASQTQDFIKQRFK